MNKDELKQYRERIGLTQGGLSKALGVANNTVSRWELGQRSIPEFLPLALETIERRLSTVGSDSVSTVGSIDNKSTVGSLSTVGSSESSKAQSAPVSNVESVRRRLKENAPVVVSNPADVFKRFKEASGNVKASDGRIGELDEVASDNELLSTVQVAERLGVSRKSVNDYIIDGKLKATKGKQNHNFVSKADLDEYVRQSKV